MTQKNSGFEIKAEQRQSWLSIAMVWAGGMICVPCLMIGGVLVGGGLSFAEIVLSVLLGYGMICAYMIFIGLGRAGRKGCALHHFHHTRHRLHRLVWHSVGRVRQRLCLAGREHAGS